VRGWVEARSAAVLTLEAANAEVPIEALFAPSERADEPPQLHDHAHDHDHDHRHEDFDSVRTWSFETPRIFEKAKLEALLDGLPPAILRAKGFVRFTDGSQQTLQLTGRRWTLEPSPEGVPSGASRLVVLGTPEMPEGKELQKLLNTALV